MTPTYVMAELDIHTVTTWAPPKQSTQPAPQSSMRSAPDTLNTRSSRRVDFPARFNV